MQLHRCRNLADLAALPEIAPNLKRLLTTSCKRIDPTAGVIDHPKLETATLDGRDALG